MAKKTSIDRNAFMRSMQQSSRETIAKVSEVQAEISSNSARSLMEENKGKRENLYIGYLKNAPENMNDYPSLKENQPDKYVELKLSIEEMGVLQPLIVWEQSENDYMILSGHNRKSVCEEILEQLGEQATEEERAKYEFIPCVVFSKDEIDKDKAQQIIDDSNTQREFSKMPERTKVNITKRKMDTFRRNGKRAAESVELLMKELGIEKSLVYENMRLANEVIDELKELYYEGNFSRKAALKFASYSSATQLWIYENFRNNLDEIHVSKLKKDMTKPDIENLLKSDIKVTKKISFNIPEELVDEIKKMVYDRLKDYE